MTIKEIAKETGFSITTVSRALNDHDDVSDETKKIIKEAARRLNYIPNINAKRLATKNSRRIGFAILNFGTASGEDHFMYEVLLGILRCSDELGYETVLLPITSKKALEERNFISNLVRANDLCGLILMGVEKNTLYYEELKQIKIPTVCIDGGLSTDYVGNVSIDNMAAFLEATDFMIKNIHKKDAPINLIFMSGRKNSIACIDRQKGFEVAIGRSNRKIMSQVYYGDYSEKKSYEIISMIMEQKVKVDGIVCANDMMAAGATRALLERGIFIPRETQIIGCDNVTIGSYIHPSISTVAMNKFDMGYTAVRLVHNIKNNIKKERNVIISHKLIHRETTRGHEYN